MVSLPMLITLIITPFVLSSYLLRLVCNFNIDEYISGRRHGSDTLSRSLIDMSTMSTSC